VEAIVVVSQKVLVVEFLFVAVLPPRVKDKKHRGNGPGNHPGKVTHSGCDRLSVSRIRVPRIYRTVDVRSIRVGFGFHAIRCGPVHASFVIGTGGAEALAGRFGPLDSANGHSTRAASATVNGLRAASAAVHGLVESSLAAAGTLVVTVVLGS